ncbi:hypothetical protein F5Y06DRAFT_308280 [Hypoxylon sp. FL0890]|nr:hypothetical protein F5Y06DRAFT_308280 [Hypoxylon sp. FL0890]
MESEDDWMKLVDFSGDDIEPVVSVDNQGWSTSEDNLKIQKFQGRRVNAPKPLVLDESFVLVETNVQHRLTMNGAQPVFDWGLGCFGNPSKIVDTGKEELVWLFWKEFNEIRTAKELFDGRQVWKRGDDDWIHFIRVYQKDEEDLIAFHQAQQVSQTESEQAPVRPHTTEAEEFLAELSVMESARSGAESEEKKVPKSIEQEAGDRTWKLKNFRDWIEEADFVEANASMPSGTRYYTP